MVYLVSFPRSGRNWLCLLLDVYNGGPVFNNRLNNPENPDVLMDFKGRYDHDHKANKNIPGRILYLYRNPVDVIFSMLNYMNVWVKQDKLLTNTEQRVVAWSNRWKNHMNKWYYNTPDSCSDKCIISYEDLVTDPTVCNFIWPIDKPDLEAISKGVSENLKISLEQAINYVSLRLPDRWEQLNDKNFKDKSENKAIFLSVGDHYSAYIRKKNIDLIVNDSFVKKYALDIVKNVDDSMLLSILNLIGDFNNRFGASIKRNHLDNFIRNAFNNKLYSVLEPFVNSKDYWVLSDDAKKLIKNFGDYIDIDLPKKFTTSFWIDIFTKEMENDFMFD